MVTSKFWIYLFSTRSTVLDTPRKDTNDYFYNTLRKPVLIQLLFLNPYDLNHIFYT